MRIKISELSNLWISSYIYVFCVLFSQIVEIFLPTTFTKVFVLALLLATLVGISKKRTRTNVLFFVVVVIGIFYIIYNYVNNQEAFSYTYPAVIVASFSILYLANIETIMPYRWNDKVIGRLVFSYLVINLVIYFLQISNCFQMNQFKGALPHTNMLGQVLFSLYLFIFWDRSKISIINKMLIVLVTLFTMSRTYIAVVTALIMIDIATVFWSRMRFIVKVFLGSALLAAIGEAVFSYLVSIIPSLSRFQEFRFGGNGREVLQRAYLRTINNSSIAELFLGPKLTKEYLSNINVEFFHSFTENSFIGFLLLFGLPGLVLLIYVIFWYIRKRRNPQTILLILISSFGLLFQDALLSVQLGIMFFLGLTIFSSQPEHDIQRERRKKKNKQYSWYYR